MRFADRIDAVGTAVANEQVTIAAPVTERIVRLNFDDGGFVQRGQIIAVLAQGQQDAQLREAQARVREAQQQLRRVEALKNRGFATRANYDTQVAAAAAGPRAGAAGRRRDRRSGDPRALLRLGQPAQHLGRRDRQPGHGDRDDQRYLDDQARFHRARDDAAPRSARASRSRRAPRLIPTSRSAATIATIDPVIDPNTRAVTVRALLPNPGPARCGPAC